MNNSAASRREKILERLNKFKARVEKESTYWTSSGLKITPTEEIVNLVLNNNDDAEKLKQNWLELVSDYRIRKVQKAKDEYLYFSMWKHVCRKIAPELPDMHQIFDVTPEESAKIQRESVKKITKDL